MNVKPSEWNFRELRIKANLSKSQCADLLGKSIKTIERWESSKPPLIAIRALEFRAGTAPGWEQFLFRHRTVTTPIGHELHPVEIEQYLYLMQLREDIGRNEGIKIATENKKKAAEVIYLDNYRHRKAK